MPKNLQDLKARIAPLREANVSYENGWLQQEAKEDLALEGAGAKVIVWCDPNTNFIKDYFVYEGASTDEPDPEMRQAVAADRREFYRDKNDEDLYDISLLDLIALLAEQGRII